MDKENILEEIFINFKNTVDFEKLSHNLSFYDFNLLRQNIELLQEDVLELLEK